MSGEPGSKIVRDWADVPKFASEAEEQAFWDWHTPAAELFDRRGHRPGSIAEQLARKRFRPHAVYSRDDDAVYVYLAWGRRGETRDLDRGRRVDYATDGTVTGVQFLHASKGLHLKGVPEPEHVRSLVKDLGLPILG